MKFPKSTIFAAVLLVSCVGHAQAWETEVNDMLFKGAVDFQGPVMIEDVPVTNTAANLNKAGDGDITAQSDTNASTTATIYTPRRVGDLLVGKTGGTNTVWVSNGTTTNDWVSFTLAIPSAITVAGANIGTSTVGTNSTVGGFETVTSWETVAGNRVMVGDTTNSERVAHGGWTNGGTVTFAVPFAAAPDVYLTYNSAPGTNLAVIATVDRTNFTTLGTTAVGKYIAVGTK